ncbi:barstar family protein [Stenotrophomonas maltophilia]|uniref:barstar family protein n=1 Tax=Stenotrophomonas maltophilia TaxID=40324 RepID=UPI0015DEFECD|nr:barstar family protein [Stenotrophomonas maltophilia]MBA0446278.1 ribonuclease inhibitor [Stenotrophomonas maltophilia]
MPLVLHIEGASINDIASLYAEINRVLMASEDWQLGPSLDALDDLLRGGYGALAGHPTATVVWRDIAHSRAALGHEATRSWLESKLDQAGRFNVAAIRDQLTALERGHGQTYFEIVMEIFGAHPRITLVAG